jgi:hypothetical protein
VAVQYLLDEHVPHEYRTQLLARLPNLVVWVVGDPSTLPRGSPDPMLLEWCETHDFLLVTSNRHSMPQHLADHLAAGRHVPGILILGAGMSFGAILDELELIAVASLPNEYRDLIVHLPLPPTR